MVPIYDWYDVRSPEQLERRKQFSQVSRLLSKVYLAFLKPYYKYPRSYKTALDVAIGETIRTYEVTDDLVYLKFYKTRYPGFGYFNIFSPAGDPFLYIRWTDQISPYWQDADFVRIFAYQLKGGLKMSFGAPIPVATGSAPFAFRIEFPDFLNTYVMLHAYKKIGSSWIISSPAYQITAVGPLI